MYKLLEEAMKAIDNCTDAVNLERDRWSIQAYLSEIKSYIEEYITEDMGGVDIGN